ncbi:kinesin-like protein KIF25 isoform X3 [Oryctolagus cuniculus]|uniref:kinesin-like protein KIF25 isoform X3 n=1 Tax=Oryctolagus cuniculus TaxID=9986 RepID=UPI0038792118
MFPEQGVCTAAAGWLSRANQPQSAVPSPSPGSTSLCLGLRHLGDIGCRTLARPSPLVYGPAESQREVFEDVRPLLTSLLDGLLSEDPSRSPRLHVSMVQVYNNDVFDLLAKDGSAGLAGAKREVTTTKEGRTEVSVLAHRAVGSARELMRLVHGGLRLRAQHPTLVHAASSRSHLIITVSLAAAGSSDSPGQLQAGPHQQPPNATPPALVPGDRAGHLQREQVQPRLQLVDLAGSECIGESGVTGLALREASFINRSLAALAVVLGALSQRRAHVPYRNSSLTHLLQDSIGGDAKLLLLVCVSPGRKHLAGTLQGLGFGTRARQVERGPARGRPPAPRRGRSREAERRSAPSPRGVPAGAQPLPHTPEK